MHLGVADFSAGHGAARAGVHTAARSYDGGAGRGSQSGPRPGRGPEQVDVHARWTRTGPGWFRPAAKPGSAAEKPGTLGSASWITPAQARSAQPATGRIPTWSPATTT